MKFRPVEVELTKDEPPAYSVGHEVSYRGDPDNIWKINSLDQGVNCWWVRASQNSVTQCFPANVFHQIEQKKRKIETVVAKPIEKPKKPAIEKPKGPDPVAALLAEAENLDQCWEIAGLAGVDLDSMKSKHSHLSNGLQRMSIGNHLRKMWKEGQFDPSGIIWTHEGFKPSSTVA